MLRFVRYTRLTKLVPWNLKGKLGLKWLLRRPVLLTLGCSRKESYRILSWTFPKRMAHGDAIPPRLFKSVVRDSLVRKIGTFVLLKIFFQHTQLSQGRLSLYLFFSQSKVLIPNTTYTIHHHNHQQTWRPFMLSPLFFPSFPQLAPQPRLAFVEPLVLLWNHRRRRHHHSRSPHAVTTKRQRSTVYKFPTWMVWMVHGCAAKACTMDIRTITMVKPSSTCTWHVPWPTVRSSSTMPWMIASIPRPSCKDIARNRPWTLWTATGAGGRICVSTRTLAFRLVVQETSKTIDSFLHMTLLRNMATSVTPLAYA